MSISIHKTSNSLAKFPIILLRCASMCVCVCLYVWRYIKVEPTVYVVLERGNINVERQMPTIRSSKSLQ